MTSLPQGTTGWICPRCERVNAPTVRRCPCERPPRPGPERLSVGTQDLEHYTTRPPTGDRR
jgi:hypothetical protein